jgi:hypothetical protein
MAENSEMKPRRQRPFKEYTLKARRNTVQGSHLGKTLFTVHEIEDSTKTLYYFEKFRLFTFVCTILELSIILLTIAYVEVG